MGAVRVGSLALSLRLPQGAGDRAGAIRERVERQFLPAVLDALGRELDLTYGDAAVLHIRSLRLRLRIGPEVRDAAELARQVGQDLAAHVRDTALIIRPGMSPAAPDAEVVVWPTREIWHAARLTAALRRTPWRAGAIEDPVQVTEQLMEADSKVVAAALTQCADASLFYTFLAAVPVEMLRKILVRSAGALPPALCAALMAAIEGEGRAAQADAPASGPTFGPSPDAVPSDDLDHVSDPPRLAVSDAEDSARPQVEADREDPAPARSISSPVPEGKAPDAARKAAPNTREGLPPAKSPALDPRPEGREAHPTESVPPNPPLVPVNLSALDDPERWPTRWGGLVYLVSLALRLGMPEALWRIGVPEGAALSAMLAAISSAPDDPLLAALVPGGVVPAASPGPVPDWARTEFCSAMIAAAQTLTGRAVADGFESEAPQDTGERTWTLEDWGAALLLETLKHLVDRDQVYDILAVEGLVEVTADRICIHLPRLAIDFDVRRAGLDANPGLLPWLDKSLVITFGSDAEDWSG